ncbi:MAG: D-alanine--D-alanine ligase [Sulfuricurvum sp.]|uniref:D-alanine--D-alanine ligase n=1 Tax=Sulfuricurvum sp. TaxID=2025608 RepID=UPI002608186E|nr:D-alanine--D-alanine ligase [Sulfuricurvum sp.]MDD2838545.1 D-alanine--D-alanine ligase [Sulfuricurvum sp.]MDD3595752.1 D-alanine--D-alanine ligase [Sulfuricurvum sp.]MDD4883303.1 D-alanine--D-alanine ligase [Sulfuricurvum sp.]
MKLAILFGGASFEHEISIVSAITIKEKLSRFELSFIFCDQDHKFYMIDPAKMKAVTFSRGEHRKMPQIFLINGGFEQRGMFGSKRFEMPVLNLIHGADGEDGTIASLFDFFGISFIGPRKEASMLSFDKHYTKWFAQSVGVKTLPYEVLRKDAPRTVTTAYPFIVKPSRLGSSIGVSIVREANELDYALDVAFEFDEIVLIEPFIAGVKEYNLAGFSARGEITYSIVEEPQKAEFLDFEKKYLDFSRSAKVAEAEIGNSLVTQLQAAFKTLYSPLFEGALIRCDFFEIDGEIYLNEINPIPGSMANYLFEDFSGAIHKLLGSLPDKKAIRVQYDYIHSISQAKGK